MVTATPQPHPRLHPWHQPIPRRPGEVQFGLLPEGPIVTGLTAAEIALLRRLDGSRSLVTSFREATACGVSATRWRELVDLLVELGLVELGLVESRPGSTSRATSDLTPGPIVVEGSGWLADELVTLLGHGLPVSRSEGCAAPTADHVAARPALVVLVGAPALDPRAGDPWLESGTAHLPVTAAGRRTTIGPLIDGPSGPCLWCLDLHRADRDAAWPTVMAQLCPGRPVDPVRAFADERGTGPLSAATLHLTAGGVAVFAQSVLTGHRPPVGISLDIWVPWPRMDHRRWEVHPRCFRHDRATTDDEAPDAYRSDSVGVGA